MSDNQNLDTITKELGTRYEVKKTAEAELAEKKGEFYKAIDVEIEATETLAQKTVTLPEDLADEEAVNTYLKVFHPGWRYLDDESEEDRTVIVEEDPAFKKFVHVNVEDGKLYRRNISQEGPSLDNERLQAEDPALWKRLTKPARVLKPMDKIPNKDLAAMQAYFVPGKMTVKLDAPRAAKPEELGDI
ncbi:MAG: hypothetical protein OK454_00150 [Thaumarchaeota archaeon]|nr:hypothetical protein [Nitrososphaerota archaeon]